MAGLTESFYHSDTRITFVENVMAETKSDCEGIPNVIGFLKKKIKSIDSFCFDAMLRLTNTMRGLLSTINLIITVSFAHFSIVVGYLPIY